MSRTTDAPAAPAERVERIRELVSDVVAIGQAGEREKAGIELLDSLAELAAELRRDDVHIDELVAALTAAQGQFPRIEKTKTATVPGKNGKSGYSYTYADLGEVLAAVRPVLAAHGLAITQRTRHIDAARVLLTTELRHTSGAVLDSEVELGQSPGVPQQFGGALTYLRRYELTTLLGIAAEDDLDAQDVEPRRPDGTAAPAPAPDWQKAASDATASAALDALGSIVGPEHAEQMLNAVRTTTGGILPSVAARLLLGIRARLEEAPRATAARQDDDAERPDTPAPDDDGTIEPPHPELNDDPEPAAPAGTVDPGELPNDPAKALGMLKAAGCTCDDPLALKHDKPAFNDTCPITGHGIPF